MKKKNRNVFRFRGIFNVHTPVVYGAWVFRLVAGRTGLGTYLPEPKTGGRGTLPVPELEPATSRFRLRCRNHLATSLHPLAIATDLHRPC